MNCGNCQFPPENWMAKARAIKFHEKSVITTKHRLLELQIQLSCLQTSLGFSSTYTRASEDNFFRPVMETPSVQLT